MQMEFNLAGRAAQRLETPTAVELLEWSFEQTHVHALRIQLAVFRGKVCLCAVIIDMDSRHGFLLTTFDQICAAAPWQEFRIVLDPIDEFEYLHRGALDQNGFFDDGH